MVSQSLLVTASVSAMLKRRLNIGFPEWEWWDGLRERWDGLRLENKAAPETNYKALSWILCVFGAVSKAFLAPTSPFLQGSSSQSNIGFAVASLRRFATDFKSSNFPRYLMLRNSAAGPGIGLPGRIPAGF